jgi:hypothetical protein
MTKDETLKLALEALKQIDEAMPFPVAKLAQKVIKEALAEPEQEPVAWNVIDPTGKIVATEMNSVRGWARIEGYKPTVEGLLGFHEQGWRVVPTTPPQRTWVGLTDEEKASFWTADQMTQKEWDELFVAIEDKLREKNS